jgi:hypothetical protein
VRVVSASGVCVVNVVSVVSVVRVVWRVG